MMNKKYFIISIILFLAGSGSFFFITSKADLAPKNKINYKKEMAILIEELSMHSKSQNPTFELIGNNPSGLFEVSSGYDKADVVKLAQNMQGVLLEAFFFGWQMEVNEETPEAQRTRILRELSYAREIGTPIFNIDYCNAARKMVLSEKLNSKANIIGFASTSYGLNRLPLYPVKLAGENSNNIKNLKEVKNFLVILDPSHYHSKKEYLDSLKETNYDLLIIDMYFGDSQLTESDIKSLKTKINGGKRLVFSYMSIGEAEDYRYYWQKNWSDKPISWIHQENPDWKGNFKVKYWDKDWKKILFGTNNSYLDKIIITGFDGAFLDIVDAWVYFEEMQQVK